MIKLIWNEIKEHVGITKIIESLEDLPSFYFKPKLFFEKFFLKGNKEKLIQVVVFSILLLLICFIAYDDADMKGLVKMLFYEIIRLTSIIAILWTANRVTCFFGGNKISTINLICFAVFVKLLIAPFQILFFGFFVFHENYNYFFIQNLVLSILYIYYLFFSGYIFQKRIRFIMVNIAANILFLNAIVGLQNLVSIDDYYATENLLHQDPILKERVDLGKDIIFYYGVPTHRVMYKLKDDNLSHFLIWHPQDSITSGSFKESSDYHDIIKRDIVELDSIIDIAHFTRNKNFFLDFKLLYQTIDSLMDIRVVEYTSNEIKKNITYLNEDSTFLYKELLIKTPDNIENRSIRLYEQQIDMEINSYYAFLPLFFVEYLTPIVKLFKESKDGVDTNNKSQ